MFKGMDKPLDIPVNFEILLYFTMQKNPKNLLLLLFSLTSTFNIFNGNRNRNRNSKK